MFEDKNPELTPISKLGEFGLIKHLTQFFPLSNESSELGVGDDAAVINPENKKIVLFDGVCNLCSSAVQYIINHDKKDIFRFVALQSELGISICKHLGISFSKMDSIILYNPGTAYFYKSSAVIEIDKNFEFLLSP